jgi:hypothetical protein
MFPKSGRNSNIRRMNSEAKAITRKASRNGGRLSSEELTRLRRVNGDMRKTFQTTNAYEGDENE